MTEASASKRLAIGTVVYMIGNLTSKVLQMLILPIITASLMTSEYGYYDLIVTTINLVTPLATFQLIEGMFRFMFNSNELERKRTVSTVTTFLLISCAVLGIAISVLNSVIESIQYPFLIFLNYISYIVFSYMQKLARCQQKNKHFAVSGVLNTIVMLGMQALTLLVFKMGVDGMLIANCVSYFAASVYLLFFLKIRNLFSLEYIDKDTFKSLFKYSAPLIPNSICWWLVSSSDRYIITLFMNTGANGVYSIAGKFSQLLTFVTSVFQLAWQESAIMEKNSKERDSFYTNTFNTYMKLLMGGYLAVLPFIRLIMPVLVDESYQDGYKYSPVLLLGAVFSAFSQFYGSAYLVFKKTNGAFYTTIIAAVINVAIGIGMIGKIGLFAPALGTTISFLVQWLIRVYQMRTYFKVKIEKNEFFFLAFMMALVTGLYYIENFNLEIATFVFGTVAFIFVNRNFIESILKKFLKQGKA